MKANSGSRGAAPASAVELRPARRPSARWRQAGERYRAMEDRERDELISNLVGHLSACDSDIQERMVLHLSQCDEEYGREHHH